MIVYDKTFLENSFLSYEAEALYKGGFIGEKQKELVEKELPGYQTQTNYLFRIGMFMLGCFLFLSFNGIIAIFTGYNMVSGFFINAILGLVVLEFLIRKKKYFANGIDDSFLFCSQIYLIIFMGSHGDDVYSLALIFALMAILGALCCIRYVDSFSAFLACIGLTAFTVDVLLKLGGFWKMVLPFALILLAVGIFFIYTWLKQNIKQNIFYDKSLNVILAFSLVLFYISGNYFFVREVSDLLLNIHLKPGEDISFAYVFYSFTLIVPFLYIYYSINKKNRLILWIDVIALAFSIFTFRYYYSIMPKELAMIIGGIILFFTALVLIKKLKGKTSGITFEIDRFNGDGLLQDIETISVLQNFNVKPSKINSDTEFGGGSFGGGGAGGNF